MQRAKGFPNASQHWIVAGILIVLLAMTRYLRDQKTPQICVDDLAASLCERRASRVTL
jgi:hypothetical protein